MKSILPILAKEIHRLVLQLKKKKICCTAIIDYVLIGEFFTEFKFLREYIENVFY